MQLHVFHGEVVPTKKKALFILLVVSVWQGQEIPHPIPDHMLMELILVGLDGY